MTSVRPAMPLFVVGYPVAVGVITRWVPVVRERRSRWFVAHTAAVGAIVFGWAIEERWSAVAVNGSWLAASVAWYAAGSRRSRPG